MNRQELEDACKRWRSTTFPAGSTSDELDELHAQLAYIDAMVADTAVPFMAGRRHGRLPEQALEELEHVTAAAARLANDPDLETSRSARAYGEYAKILREVSEGLQEMQ